MDSEICLDGRQQNTKFNYLCVSQVLKDILWCIENIPTIWEHQEKGIQGLLIKKFELLTGLWKVVWTQQIPLFCEMLAKEKHLSYFVTSPPLSSRNNKRKAFIC